ncbi:MAG: ATP-binding cassette domain-containing protein [Patescibacteria group bacterium]
MSGIIQVQDLQKTFKVYNKAKGLKASLQGLFYRQYRNVEAVQNISFEIQEGEMVGFIGPNGAGKTTTLKMLSGLIHPTSGIINVLDFQPSERRAQYLKQISLVMGQKNQLWWDLPAIESFELNKAIYEIPDTDYNHILNELTEILDLQDVLQRQVRKLSLGQRMKCELLGALLHQPKVLFLDEPTIGLDIVMQKKVREFLKYYNHKYNSTVMLTSHYMDDVSEICKRVIVINKGQILFDGELQKLIHKYADFKTLVFVLKQESDVETLKEHGQLSDIDFPKVSLKVPREQVSKIAGQILNQIEVDDLEINEIDLEDVIQEVLS